MTAVDHVPDSSRFAVALKKSVMPAPAVIEIIERGLTVDEDRPITGVIAPNEVRINGIPLLASADHPVIVHEIVTTPRDAVVVTLTLFARRVFIGPEGELPL